jgi:hypothetical protein
LADAELGSLADRRIDAISRGYLAELLTESGDLLGAEQAALRAVEALGAFPPFCARAFGALAQALLAQDRVHDALGAARRGIALIEAHGTVLTGESLLRLTHARALERSGDHESARQAIRHAAARLHERASHIADPTARETFLNAAPENAATLALAAAEPTAGTPT